MSHNKQLRQRRANVQRPEKQLGPRTIEQIHEYLVRHFYLWTQSLRTTPTFEFDQDATRQHRCKMFLPIFPHLQSVGNQGRSKQEAKANAIIALLAHLEKRRQAGLFVPSLTPNLVRYVQREIQTADVPMPDMSLNENEFLLAERIVPKNQEKRLRPVLNFVEEICQVRSVFLLQSTPSLLIYFVGRLNQKAIVTLYVQAMFEAENEQFFQYAERLAHVFRDGKFLREVCQRLRVICEDQPDKHQLSVRGSRENVSTCFNEFVALHREFDVQGENRPATQVKRAPSPVLIELSDDSNDQNDSRVAQTSTTFQLPPPPQFKTFAPPPAPAPLMQLRPVPMAKPKLLRHIVLDGQNIGRNSNDFKRTFSWMRLSNAINYFKSRGHQHVVAFLPLYYRDQTEKLSTNANECHMETRIRDELIQSQLIVFTPSRYNNGKRLTNYDDRFILQYAADNDGIVVSNDNFRDLEREAAFQYIIRHRILPFATVNNTFMPASDPLGRNGPKLEEFLCKSNAP